MTNNLRISRSTKYQNIIEKIFGFDHIFYAEVYSDVRGLSRKDLFFHWLLHGIDEGRIPSWKVLCRKFKQAGTSPTQFNPYVYVSINKELIDAHIENTPQAAIHYLQVGKKLGLKSVIDLPQFVLECELASEEEKKWGSTESIFQVEHLPAWDQQYAVKFTDVIETKLIEYSLEDFIISCFIEYYKYAPLIGHLDLICTHFDYGKQSRFSFLHQMALDTGRFDQSGLFLGKTESESLTFNSVDHSKPEASPSGVTLMGKEIMSRQQWFEKAYYATKNCHGNEKQKVVPALGNDKNFNPRASVICSVYRSEKYLEHFLSNLKEQTVSNEIQYVFILVDPSQIEIEAYSSFQASHQNVTIHISSDRIGIYEAWNIAVQLSSAPYITNMNVDDFRRPDSLEIQIGILDRFSWVDVVYQDVFISLDAKLPWEVLTEINAKISLPISTPATFMSYINPPHNAPMWRRNIHDDVGLFNEKYKSAGDVDFWLRCSRSGKTFYNITDPHVSYFENPFGLSTEADTPGVKEQREIILNNKDLLLSVNNPFSKIRYSNLALPRAERLTLSFIESFSKDFELDNDE